VSRGALIASRDARRARLLTRQICHHGSLIARRYGVSPTWYAETLQRQGGGCAICGDGPGKRRLHVDHDHSHCAADRACPECVRGLLCSKCNSGIGMFNEDADRFRAALAYLENGGRLDA
jgi:hypothetical protein